MRKINVLISIDEELGVVGVAEDLTNSNLPEGIDKTIYMMGIYSYLFSRQFNKIKSIQKGKVQKW